MSHTSKKLIKVVFYFINLIFLYSNSTRFDFLVIIFGLSVRHFLGKWKSIFETNFTCWNYVFESLECKILDIYSRTRYCELCSYVFTFIRCTEPSSLLICFSYVTTLDSEVEPMIATRWTQKRIRNSVLSGIPANLLKFTKRATRTPRRIYM